MDADDHAFAGPGSTDKDVLNIFVRSYHQANRRFPQTRCYFVVDFASRIEPAHLVHVLSGGLAIPGKTIQSLAKIANLHHKNRLVSKAVTSETIRADVGKMISALTETYETYARLRISEACHADFIADCTELKIRIDRHDLSPDYLEFVSPRDLDRSAQIETLRIRNTFMEDRILNSFGERTFLMQALEPEITRSLWVLRPREPARTSRHL